KANAEGSGALVQVQSKGLPVHLTSREGNSRNGDGSKLLIEEVDLEEIGKDFCPHLAQERNTGIGEEREAVFDICNASLVTHNFAETKATNIESSSIRESYRILP